MSDKTNWKDITELLKSAASEIRPGQFIAGPDFSFEASMRAIDIMDEKIDTGLGAMDIDPLFYRVNKGDISYTPSDTDLLHIVECILSTVFSWFKGDSLNHSLMQNLFVHTCVSNGLKSEIQKLPKSNPSNEDYRKSTLFSFIYELFSLLRYMRDTMGTYRVFENDEFDWSCGFSINIPVSDDIHALVHHYTMDYLQASTTSPLLLLHYQTLHHLMTVFKHCSETTKDSYALINSSINQFYSSLLQLADQYKTEPVITTTWFFDETFCKFTPTIFPSRVPPTYPYSQIMKELIEQTQITMNYIQFLTPKLDLYCLVREFTELSFYSLFPFYRCILFKCIRLLYPTSKEVIDLVSRSAHIALTVLKQKSLAILIPSITSVVDTLLQCVLQAPAGIQRRLENLITSTASLSGTLLEVMKVKKCDNGEPFGDVILHKLTYFPCLLSFYLCICLTHCELRLGIYSPTELPMMLWFLDTLVAQFKEMEKNYMKLPCKEEKVKKGKGKNKGKTSNDKVLDITPLLSDYWEFFINYERGLLFMLISCIRLNIMKTNELTFSSMDILFQQRIMSVLQSGLIPKPSYADFEQMFSTEQYEPLQLMKHSITYFERSQQTINAIKQNSSAVSDCLIKKYCLNYQRATLMNILAAKKLVSAFGTKTKEDIQQMPLKITIQLTTDLLPTVKVMNSYYVCFKSTKQALYFQYSIVLQVNVNPDAI